MKKGLILSLCALVFFAGCSAKNTVNNRTANNTLQNEIHETNSKESTEKTIITDEKQETQNDNNNNSVKNYFGNYQMTEKFSNIINKNLIDNDYNIEMGKLSASSKFSTYSWVKLENKYNDIWDKELNAIYKKLLSKLNKDEQKLLIDSQKAWLQFHLNDPKFVNKVFYNRESGAVLGSHGKISMVSVQTKRIRERTLELMEYYYMLGNDVEFQYKGNSKEKEITNEERTKKSNEADSLGKITDVFPDPSMAERIASILKKKIDDTVTKKELGSINGIFHVPVNDTYSLKGIGYLTGLTGINCCKNNVEKIPEEIGNLTNLEILDCCKAYSLMSIPPEIGKLKKLKLMRLSMSGINALPKEIGELSNLELLFCPSMDSIPKEIGSLKNLRILICENLKSVPEEIGNLENLEDLDIHGSNLGESINSITKLKNLRKLDMGRCNIKELPKDIGDLKNLEHLNLFGNDIRKIPVEIGKLVDLESLNTYDNYNLDEDYEKYFPKEYYYEKKIVKGQDCIIELPDQLKGISKLTYQLKQKGADDSYNNIFNKYGDFYSGLLTKYHKYTTIIPEKTDNNNLLIKSSLLPKKGACLFRIVVENEENYPLRSVYKWLITVK